MGGGHTSNRIKDANLKSNLMGNIRNMSVPRGSQQKSYMLSSQDYASNNPNAYYQNDKILIPGKNEKLSYNRAEALNSSVGNIKIGDHSSSYGIDVPPQPHGEKLLNLNDTAPLITSNPLNATKQHSIFQGTLRSCNCPCNCQLM